MQFIKRTLESVGGTELERKVKTATSDVSWSSSNSELYSIATATYEWDDFDTVNSILWQRLDSSAKNYTLWKMAIKCLALCEFLLRYGHARFIDECITNEHIHILRRMRDYNFVEYVESHAIDRGNNIRDRVNIILGWLTDMEELRHIRVEAEKNKGKYQGQGGDTRRASFSEASNTLELPRFDDLDRNRRWSGADSAGAVPESFDFPKRRASDASAPNQQWNEEEWRRLHPSARQDSTAQYLAQPTPYDHRPNTPPTHPGPRKYSGGSLAAAAASAASHFNPYSNPAPQPQSFTPDYLKPVHDNSHLPPHHPSNPHSPSPYHPPHSPQIVPPYNLHHSPQSGRTIQPPAAPIDLLNLSAIQQ